MSTEVELEQVETPTEEVTQPAKKRVRRLKANKAEAAPAPPEAPRVAVSSRLVKNSEGKLDWKAAIDPQFIVLNDELFLKKGVNVSELSEEEQKELKRTSPESMLLIKLQGFKDVAHLRGYSKSEVEVVESGREHAVVKYTFHFLPNEENPQGLVVSALGNANRSNVEGEDFQSFLEIFAENRALIRAVKNALNINILGQDELPAKKINLTVTSKGPASVQNALQERMKAKGLSFDDIKKQAMNKPEEYPGADTWTDVNSIPTHLALIIIKKMDSKKTTQ